MSVEEARRIPGWMSVRDLTILATQAASVRPGGTIVEVGPFLGRSTYAMARACDPSVTYFVVDPWTWLPDDYGPNRPGGPIDPNGDAEALFDRYTRGCRNIVKIKGYSPSAHPPVPPNGFDFVFIDGDHRSPAFDEDVKFYFERMAPNGILMGDDYYPNWPNIIEFVHRFAAEKGISAHQRGDKLWELVWQRSA